MIFQCNSNHTCGKHSWTGEINILSHTPYHTEAVINARGSSFHVITGSYEYGNYLCIPNIDFGCELSYLSDTFWNTESISRHLDNPVDVESLVSALKIIGCLDETI